MLTRQGIEKWIEDGHWPSFDFPEDVLKLYNAHIKLRNEHSKLRLKYDRLSQRPACNPDQCADPNCPDCNKVPSKKIEDHERAMRHCSVFMLELRKELTDRPAIVEEIEALSDLLQAELQKVK